MLVRYIAYMCTLYTVHAHVLYWLGKDSKNPYIGIGLTALAPISMHDVDTPVVWLQKRRGACSKKSRPYKR